MEKYEKENLFSEVLKKFYKNRRILSDNDKCRYTEYCICAYEVYKELCWSGFFYVNIDDSEFRKYIEYAMYVEWLMMHKDDNRKKFNYVSSTDKCFLEIFDSLVDIVNQNGDKYLVDSVEDYELFDYESEERKILGLPQIEDDDRKFLDLSRNRII